MYAVFGLKSLVIGVLALILLVFLGVTWQERPDDEMGLVSLLWRVASLTIGAIFLLGNIRPVFRWIWKAAEACSDSLFPDLTGIWKGQLRSNISVHEALQNAANSRERTFIRAAELEVLHKNDQLILSGFYWTARNWRNGRNTAGTLRFVRT